MQKKIMIAVLLGSCFIPCISNAETAGSSATSTPSSAPATTSSSDKSGDVSKTTWLNAIVPMLPGLICKGFMNDPELKQRLDSIKMTYDQCVSVIPESVNKCQNQLAPSIPDKINNDDASTWGKSLGECIGKDFAMKYLVPK